MVVGIGTDIFEVKRIKERITKEPSFIKGIYTENEITYCEKLRFKEQHYAARYAAKEAFLKAIGTGWRNGIKFNEIEILNDELGKPEIKLTGKAREIVKSIKGDSVHISLSHTKDLAIAFIIINNDQI